MNEHDILAILGNVNAVITDSHVVYTSGKHGSAYVNKDAIYPHTELTSKLCLAMAEAFQHDQVDAVVAPAIGGVILSQWTAHHLSHLNGRKVYGVYAEKADDGFVIKRGYDAFITGKNVLVVEDILNTGGSAKKVVETVRNMGGKVVGLSVLCNRGGVTPEEIGVTKLVALINVKLDAWDANHCPLCQQGVPINTSVGKGKLAQGA